MSYQKQSSYVSPVTKWETMARALQWAGVGSLEEIRDLPLTDVKALYANLCAVKDAEWRAQGGEGESLGFLV